VIDGQDVTITINKKDSESAATFEIDIPQTVTDKAVLEFLLVHMGINISNDALNLLQSDLHEEVEGSQRGAGQILVKPRTYFRQSIAPLIGLWVNSVFDESFKIDGKEYTPIITFDKRYFGKDQLGVNNFAPYYMQLYPMASILQIVHNENTSNVIKNGKGNNVPTTQLTTIQQDGPTLYRSIKREEAAVKRKNAEQFRKRLVEKLQPNISEIVDEVQSVLDSVDTNEFYPDEKRKTIETETEFRLGDDEYMLYIDYEYRFSDADRRNGGEFCDIYYSLVSFGIEDMDGTVVSNDELDITYKTYEDLFKEYKEEDVECGIYDPYEFYGVSRSDFFSGI
jgi:hypothetical protein